MNIEAGKESVVFSVNLGDLLEKIALPTMLLGKGFDGVSKAIECLGIPFKKNQRIKGFSESEYIIPFCLEDKEKLVLLEPLLIPGFMEAFGLGEYAYGAAAPFLALDFFKYVDIINAQNKPTIMAFFGLTSFKEVSSVNFIDLIKAQLKNMNIPTKKEEVQKSIENKNIFEFFRRTSLRFTVFQNFKFR